MTSLSKSLSREGGFAAAVALAVGTLAASMGAVGAQPARQSRDVSKFQCTNPTSGTTWDVKVDYGQKTADSFPATITKNQISWHDTVHGGSYYLDRASGALTFKNATTTGGYVIHDTCRAG